MVYEEKETYPRSSVSVFWPNQQHVIPTAWFDQGF